MLKLTPLVAMLALLSSQAHGACDYDDFPRMDSMLLGMVADGMQWNNNAMNVRSFRVPATPEQRSEEHTSELQSRENLVCRLLLEKKKDDARDRGGGLHWQSQHA